MSFFSSFLELGRAGRGVFLFLFEPPLALCHRDAAIAAPVLVLVIVASSQSEPGDARRQTRRRDNDSDAPFGRRDVSQDAASSSAAYDLPTRALS